ncbi:MAG TPA: hypothetical protein VK876_04585 [Rubrivivax sp.]|nr:hypothetical protein [Rubrivivax sp.]
MEALLLMALAERHPEARPRRGLLSYAPRRGRPARRRAARGHTSRTRLLVPT